MGKCFSTYEQREARHEAKLKAQMDRAVRKHEKARQKEERRVKKARRNERHRQDLVGLACERFPEVLQQVLGDAYGE